MENISAVLIGKGNENFQLTSNVQTLLDEMKEIRNSQQPKLLKTCESNLLSRKQFVRLTTAKQIDFETTKSYDLMVQISSGKTMLSIPV